MRNALLAVSALLLLSGCDSLRPGADDGDLSATLTVSGASVSETSVSFEDGRVTLDGRGGVLLSYQRGGDYFQLGLHPVGSAELGVGTFDVVRFPARVAEPNIDGFDGMVLLDFGEPLRGIWATQEGTITVESATPDEVSGTLRVVAESQLAEGEERADEEVSIEATFRAVR